MDILPSSTLSNVDKFVESQMRAVPLDEIQGEMTEENSRKYIPKFTVDGYGKWREVKGEQNISSYNSQNFQDSSMLDAYRNLLHSGDIEPRPQYSRYNTSHSPPSTAAQNDTGSVSRATSSLDRSSTKESFRSYKNLSNSLRSNVFPGAGKDKWGSSTKTEFVSQSLPDSWAKPTANFGITKDSYMKWAEHDVYRQRLMKAWDKYVADAPNQKDKVHYGIAPVKKPPKEEKPPERQNKKVVKKSKEKKKKTNTEKNVAINNKPNENEIQTRKIEVQPANSDDSFWNFYEQPFAQ